MEDELKAWLTKNKDEIAAKIERGLAQLYRGEGMTGDELRTRLEDYKAAWRKERSGL